ncbi:hypothetical protein SARC_13559, partial [Sphaeroforma arctica JP610]
MSGFEFATATRIIFGAGCAQKQLPGVIAGLNCSRVYVVTGTQSRYADLITLLNPVAVFEMQSLGEPTVDIAKLALERAVEANADMVVSIGGGSVIDLGKIVAALTTNG